MSHFFGGGKSWQFGVSLLCLSVNSPGPKGRPRRPPPPARRGPSGGAGRGRGPEPPRGACGGFFPGPRASRGSGEPRRFCGLWAGPKRGTPGSKPLNLPGLTADSPQAGLLENDGRGEFGGLRAGAHRRLRRASGGGRGPSGGRGPGVPPPSLPPSRGGAGDRHTARGPHLRRALGATASPRRGGRRASDARTLPSVT